MKASKGGREACKGDADSASCGGVAGGVGGSVLSV